jgi:hypothetical protein
LRMSVFKPKYEKSVIRWVGRLHPDHRVSGAGAKMTLL